MQEKAEQNISEAIQNTIIPEHYVVGIGASAGGLEAINELFDNIPQRTDFSYVIVQHLSPDHKSLMDELLAKHTKMKISVAEEGMVVHPNCVYLIPSKKILTIRHNKLHLSDKNSSSSPNHAIDLFFESLAKDKGKHAIGIVLSGTGTDGTRGVEAIKKKGGMVIAQDPVTAKFDGMPNSAIDSGNTDYILPPELMAEKILQYPDSKSGIELKRSDFNDAEDILMQILELVHENTSHDFTAYKPQTLERRILRRMALQNIEAPTEYLHYLRNNPDEVDTLGREFLIGVTRFFRDPAAFQLVQHEVVPAIISQTSQQEQVKVWVPACSTGEEAYSLAILFQEYLDEKNMELNVKIFATDIDPQAIETAAKGLYPLDIEKDVTEERLAAYFTREGKKYCISKHIRKMVIFAQHNLLKDPPFSKIDLVSCRNMLIYMKPELQKKILSTFHFSLKLGGYLFLGSSETSNSLKDALEIVSKKWNIYKTISVNKNYVINASLADTERAEKRSQVRTPNVKPSVNSFEKKMKDVFSETMLEELGYAAFFIDEHYHFLQALGDYKKFLVLPDKKLEMNLLEMVPKQLSIALGIALRKAGRLNEKTYSSDIRVNYGEYLLILQLVVKPYLDTNQFNKKFIFVLIREEKHEQRPSESDDLLENQVSMGRLSELEAELKETKQSLQSTVEELETSNEELQSSNEELISSNEELQSTNEELQSLNEELHTVNAEHQMKIKELSELNDDLNNYFRSTEIGQLFVDKELLIRKYTPAVAKQINIIESDIGRPISHFSFNIKYAGLVDDIRHVLLTQEPIEQEIELQSGQYFQMRVLPYIRQDRTVDGVVVTFVDITSIKNLNNLLSGVLESSLNGIMALRSIKNPQGKVVDFEWTLVNGAAEKMFRRKKDTLHGQRLSEELPGMAKAGILGKFIQVVEKSSSVHEELHYHYDGVEAWFEVVAVRIENGIAVTFAQITEKKKAEEELFTAYEEVKHTKERLVKLNNELENRVAERTRELSESEERFRLVSLATNDAIWDWNLVTNELWWSEAFKEIFGYRGEDIQPGVESWFDRIYTADRERVITQVNKAINEGRKKWTGEYRFTRADGSHAFVYNRAYVLQDENGVPYRMIGSLIDLSNLKKAQDELKRSNENLIKINTDLDNFVYTASHDLKSPIANVEGLLTLLKQKMDGKADERDIRLFEMLENSVDKLKSTVKALTEITKVQKDADSRTELLSFDKILGDVESDIQKMIQQNDVIIKNNFQVPEIQYTKINLRSIFYNMLSNAIKYRHPGRQPVIYVGNRKKGDYILLTFKDNGLGMSPAQVSKLFTMFKRFHTHVEGTGIGLYMVKRMIENRGGKIEVESEEGSGTLFRIYLKE